MTFEWDETKDQINKNKHGVGFEEAQEAFCDERRVILYDKRHSQKENRYFLFGKNR